jgi:hypothetical protein
MFTNITESSAVETHADITPGAGRVLCAAFECIKMHPVWGMWREETNPNNPEKLRKVPYQANRTEAKSNDPKTWCDFNTADGAHWFAEIDGLFEHRHGLALFFADIGGGLRTGDIDLDTCRDLVTGAIEPWAQAIIREFASYTEVSPSGTGVKIFFFHEAARLPEFQRMMGTKTGKQFKRGGGEHPAAIELYLCGRYFTVNGAPLTPLNTDR